MRLCERTVKFVQVINEDGDVRICGWLKDGGVIGRLSDNTMEEIYHSAEAKLIRDMHANCDYSNCNPNACPWVANENVDAHSISIDKIPQFPETLYLAYENVCNYRCVMCTIPDCMQKSQFDIREDKLNKIDNELRKILPYVKNISANGLGELFVSKHIMKLLAEWTPLAKPEECSVNLETNGSLFNEVNWNKISNLGKYDLSVAITVLGISENTYQELSGTTLPLDNLINNLKFVRKLREEGIINKLTIATVYQQKNFRELPKFAKMAIEEFGADYVRLRPYEPWKEVDMAEWFKDVRNEYHPNHKEFLDIMKDPIFQHPKVHDWGGGKTSGLGPEPYIRTRARYNLLDNIFCKSSFDAKLKESINTKKIVVYGMALVGKALTTMIDRLYEIPYCIDKAMNGEKFLDIPIYDINHCHNLDKDVTVIVSLDRFEDTVISLLKKMGYRNVISLNELV